ncbi:type II secretion system F family protein [Actimicrobium antarcticum]|uniref:Type II secretion system F family protein n=1 Tax=Actimicrobium antarcticum TaxID=1051899 RepID=A0ABP7SPG9_9BURK
MNSTALVIGFSLTIFLAVGLLSWVLIELGGSTMQRYRASFTDRTRFQAQEFFLFIDPAKLFIANLAIMMLGAVLAWIATGSALLALPVFFGLALLPRLAYRWMRQRRLRQFDEQLPDALLMLSGGLRAGIGLNAATQQLVAESQPPLAQEFSLLLREQRLGVTLEQSLSNLSRRIPTATTTLVVSAMRIAAETGGGLAETLERTSHTVRSRLQMEGKIVALTAQGKLQAWVVGMLPIGLMMVLNKMEPVAMSHLWNSRIGWATLAVIAFLEIMGVVLIRKIVAIDV